MDSSDDDCSVGKTWLSPASRGRVGMSSVSSCDDVMNEPSGSLAEMGVEVGRMLVL